MLQDFLFDLYLLYGLKLQLYHVIVIIVFLFLLQEDFDTFRGFFFIAFLCFFGNIQKKNPLTFYIGETFFK